MKLLIFGRNGQVGGQLVRQLDASYPDRVLQADKVIAVDIDEVDLTNSDATRQIVMDTAPDWVINTSAHTAVDLAESEPDLAHQINAIAPETIATACADVGAAMVHYSTDYVFDGSSSEPYLEDDLPNPQSVYGRTKLAGEQAVSRCLPRSLQFRTAWVYSADGKNFVNTMLRLAADRDELNVVSDQWGSPTLADDLAAVTLGAIQQIETVPNPPRFGLYHATGQGVTNWSGFSEAIMQLSGNAKVRINPIPSSEYPTPAPRPAYSVLSNQKLKTLFGLELPAWQNALERCLLNRGA